MVDHDRNAGVLRGQVPEILHVLPVGLHARNEIVLLEQREAAVEIGLDEIVAVGEVPDATHVRELTVALEDSLHVRVPQVGVCDDAVGEPRSPGCLLEPLGLLDRVLASDRGLNVDRLGHVRVTALRDVVLGGIVPLRELL